MSDPGFEYMSVASTESQHLHGADARCERACVRDDDRILYGDVEDRELRRKIFAEKRDTGSRSGTSCDLDSLHSGESMFKTFVFEMHGADTVEMAKCIDFWKRLMEKSLKPVRFTRKLPAVVKRSLEAEKIGTIDVHDGGD